MGAQWSSAASAGRGASAPFATIDADTAPEDVLISWLLCMPDDADLRQAAADEIARLDRNAPLAPGLERLRAMLGEIAAGPARQ